MDAPMQIKVAVAHGMPLVRAGLQTALVEQCDVALTRGWSPADGARALDIDTRVLIADAASGLVLADELRSGAGPRRCQVMLVTDQVGEWDIRQAIARGVMGYYLLDSPLERILSGVRLLAQGNRSFDTPVAARMADWLLQPTLTERERDVLSLIVDGSCNKDVAKSLGIAVGTVKGHVRVLLDKLGVNSRVQAVIVAKQRGLVGQPMRSWGMAGRAALA